MVGVRGVIAGLVAATSFFGSGFGVYADDRATALYFAGTDLWSHGSFSYGGLLWAPEGLEQEGFTFKALVGGGAYRYRSGALGNAFVDGSQLTGFALIGRRFVSGKTFVTVLGGLDLQRHTTSPHDPGCDLNGTHVGVRGAIEFWHEPDATTMVAGDASLSSIGPSYSARAAVGWRLGQDFYIGPEIGGFAHRTTYRQIRAGVHVTGLRWSSTEWSAAAGWTTDSDDRSGFYARIGLHRRQ